MVCVALLMLWVILMAMLPNIELGSDGIGRVLMYVHLSDCAIERTVELSDSVSVDYDADGEVVGIEVV